MAGRPLITEIIRPAEEGEYDELAAEPNFLGVCVRRTAPRAGLQGAVHALGVLRLSGVADDYVESVRDEALAWKSRGGVIVPARFRSKRATDPGWLNLRLTDAEIRRRFKQSLNLALNMGASDLIDFDLDCPEAIAAARILMPKTMCFGHASAPRSHYLIRGKGLRRKTFGPRGGPNLLELRGDGHMTIVPPSIHESGEPIVWYEQCEPVVMALDEVLELGGLIASAALIGRAWPSEGSRQDCMLALAGALCVHGLAEA